ncbi:Acg family FMN-binding oxidoreductase [Kribbella lupini]|uniref:Nitroreductase n=1 Tax=Kribbella lupini TaxID=291602 RepID=A0ABP4LD95_9ACTN
MSDDRLSMEQIDTLLSAAVAAPSMHNTQPWRFEVEGHVVDVFIDGSRALLAEDPTGRAMRIATGAAIFNLRCAAAWMGFSTWFGLCPDPREPDLVGRLVLEPVATPDNDLCDLYGEIPRRHTSRTPVAAEPLFQDDRLALIRAALQEKAELTWLPDDRIDSVMDLVLDTDLREIHDWHRSAERTHWIGGDRPHDGVPSGALGPRSDHYPAAVRDLGTAPSDRTRPRAAFEDHPALAVLSTEHDEAGDQVAAGIALERILLTATRRGIAASFLNQLLEYDDLRRKVQRTTGKAGFADMVIRFGRNRTPAVTGRRPVADVVTIRSEEQS